jgi:hypothetical protein
LTKPLPPTTGKPIPEQKVDKQLWREIREKAVGSESQKVDAVRLLFERHGDLPKESTKLIQELANKHQPVAVRSAIAHKLGESRYLFDSPFLKILGVLRNDPDPLVRSTTEEIYKQLMQPIAEIFKSIQTTIQSIRIPQIELPNLGPILVHLEDNLAAVARQVVLPHLSARALTEPIVAAGQVLDGIARSTLATLPSYYPQPDLDVIGRIYPKLKKSQATRLRSKLANCVPGKGSWKAYQDVCREILRYALVPPLLEPSEEAATMGRAQRRDLIFQIPYDAGDFWGWIKLTYKSLALIVECKNYADLLPASQLTITSKYFGEKKLGLFGAITCRKGLSDSARQEQTRLWMEDEKMILSLTDVDMINMLALKEANDDPSKVIDKAIRSFRQSI